jgi:BioD-like phosphotransacetylase family protein
MLKLSKAQAQQSPVMATRANVCEAARSQATRSGRVPQSAIDSLEG